VNTVYVCVHIADHRTLSKSLSKLVTCLLSYIHAYICMYVNMYVFSILCVCLCARRITTPITKIFEWTGNMLIFIYTRTHVHICKYVCIYIYVYCVCGCVCGGSLHLWTKSLSGLVISLYSYGVATTSRLLKMIGLFCRI